MAHQLNYNQLYYFYVVATEGSIKSACDKLHLTQPTISGQLKTLEDSFGFPLFDRSKRHLKVNDRGQDILKKAEKIFLLGDDLLTSLSSQSYSLKSRIKIGVAPSVSAQLAAQILDQNNDFPDQYIQVQSGNLRSLVKALDSDQLDFILSDTPAGFSKKYKALQITKKPLKVVASAPLKTLSKDFPQSLDEAPYVCLSEGNHTQENIDFYFKMKSLRPRKIASADNLEMILAFLSSQTAFSLFPHDFELPKNQKVVEIGVLEDIEQVIWAITSSFGSQRKLVGSFLKNLKRKPL